MTMKDVLDQLVTLLRADMTAPVEAYWRVEPPSELTVFVQPSREVAEEGMAVGDNFISGWTLSIIVEVPWDDTESTGEDLDDAVEQIKTVIGDNRQPITGEAYVMMAGDIQYVFVQRPGASDPVFAAVISCEVTYPL